MALRQFKRDTRGAVAMTMALSVLMIGAAVGAAVDYSRISSARTLMQSAVDSAALRAGKTAIAAAGTTRKWERAKIARQMFNAIYRQEDNPPASAFKVTESAELLRVEAAADIPTHFGFLLGTSSVAIHAVAEVPIGVSTLEVALVLDNTGSMARLNKMVELKASANLFLDTIEAARANGGLGAAPVAVVPFNTQVNIGPGLRFASYLRFDGLAAPEPLLQITSALWEGCVTDRDRPDDVGLKAPNVGDQKTLFPGAKCQYAGLSGTLPLTSDYVSLRAVINGMTPTGNTNTAMGMAWGYNVLTNGMPLGDAAQPAGAKRNNKVMIFLTDGTNTEDRYSKVQSDIDARMSQLCDVVKKKNVEIFTVRLLEGNETLLRDCASTPDNYFNVMQSSDLQAVFRKIAERLVVLRLSS